MNCLEQSQIFTLFFDNEYTELLQQTAVCAAHGAVNGKPTYAICQNGQALQPEDVQCMQQLLQLAAKTGNPVVTFYNSIGMQLEDGLQVLKATRELTQTIGKISGVVVQLAVVLGTCAGTAAIQAASADLCLMAKQAELFLTAPFVSEANGDVLEGAGSAEFAEKAGVAAAVYETVEQTISAARDAIMLLPMNNLDCGVTLEYQPPKKPLDMQDYCRIRAGASLIDHDRDFELFPHYGSRNSYTALGTIEGETVGVVATSDRYLEHESVTKIARFVRLCDAYNIPVVTLVHNKGFVKNSSEDLAGGICEPARLAGTYADATTAKVAILAGKVIGPLYTALCNADLTIALEGCVVSPIEPKAAVEILHHEELKDEPMEAIEQAAAEYMMEYCSADAVLCAGLAQMKANESTIRDTVAAALRILKSKRAERLPKKHGNMAL